MPNKNDILDELFRSKFIDDLIWTITSGHQLKDDLKCELFLILCEMDDSKIINAYNNHYLNYLCVNILKKQYHSKTSPFHKMWRIGRPDEEPFDIEDEVISDDCDIIEKVYWFVENKLDLVDRELFKIYYKIGRYDRWVGDLRDKTCQKPISSIRKVEKKLAITTVQGKKVSIARDTIHLSLNRSMMRIKHYLKENGLDRNN